MSDSEHASRASRRTENTEYIENIENIENTENTRDRTAQCRSVSWRAIVAAVLTIVALLLPAPALAEPAPDPLASAQSRASALRTQVDDLEVDAALAGEHFNAITEQLGAATSRVLSAQAWADALRGVRHEGSDSAVARARAVYMGGGSLALYASVLDGADLGDVLTRMESVRTLIGADASRIRADDRAISSAEEQIRRLDAAEAEAAALRGQVRDAALEVERLVAERSTLLSQADAEVSRLVAEQRAAAEAAAVERARAALVSLGDPGGLPPAGSELAARAIAAARTKLGVPYVWGATGPDTFDCSGLTGWAYRQAGLRIPRIAEDQWFAGPHVPLAELAPGDLVFWAKDVSRPATIYHVGIYLGAGQTLQAPRTGDVVKITPLRLEKYIGAVRLAPISAAISADAASMR